MPKSMIARDGGGLRPSQKFDDLIRQVAKSDTFRSAPVMQSLLLYLWKHQGQSISEYAIATEALGRPPAFDPKSDSTVRVQVARLRAKLKEFYEGAGESFPLRLTLPLGGHELRWTHQPPHKSFASKFNGLPKSYLWGTGLTGLSLLVLCASLLVQVHTLKASLPPAPTPMPRFWQSFLMAGKATQIVVPSPLYFYWPSHHVCVRDFKVSGFDKWGTSPFIKDTAEKWGPPELSQPYVGAAEMTAGISILQYLEKAGQQVRLVESRRFPAVLFGAQNTVFLGMPRNARYLDEILSKTNYYLARVDPDVVVKSRSPRPGEPEEYRDVAYSPERRMTPAIIILLPARPEHTRTLLLLGKYITATTSMLVSAEGIKSLDAVWAKAGSPDAWEMVIEAEVYRDTILKSIALSCRPIPATFWK